jgi:hypothetical protein
VQLFRPFNLGQPAPAALLRHPTLSTPHHLRCCTHRTPAHAAAKIKGEEGRCRYFRCPTRRLLIFALCGAIRGPASRALLQRFRHRGGCWRCGDTKHPTPFRLPAISIGYGLLAFAWVWRFHRYLSAGTDGGVWAVRGARFARRDRSASSGRRMRYSSSSSSTGDCLLCRKALLLPFPPVSSVVLLFGGCIVAILRADVSISASLRTAVSRQR